VQELAFRTPLLEGVAVEPGVVHSKEGREPADAAEAPKKLRHKDKTAQEPAVVLDIFLAILSELLPHDPDPVIRRLVLAS
jgi:hypothetical protein